MKAFIILAMTVLVLSASAPEAVAQDPTPRPLEVYEHTLENGLRLFILPRHGVPIASFVVQYKIGGVNETPGSTGIAHFLEHLLFKGTTSVGTSDYETEKVYLEQMDRLFDSILVLRAAEPRDTTTIHELLNRIRNLEDQAAAFVTSNEFDLILSENGSRRLNATTTNESTTYFVELPSTRAELWFVMEADRMRNPVFREFYAERDVVAEERRMRLENNPGSILYHAHMAAAFQKHPYGNPVVGFMEDLQGFTRAEVGTYFRRYYGPNNAVVAIAGDVDPGQILGWAREYFEPIPKGEPPPPVRIQEPRQTGERRVEVVYDAEPALRIGWKVPPSQSEDGPALYMLTSLLTGGRSSRLYRRLVLEDRIATGVLSSIEPGQLFPGLFTVQASPLRPHTALEVEAAIYDELEELHRNAPTEGEIQRVRNQLEASEVRRLRSNFGLALQVAGAATLFGDWRVTFDFTERLLQVTPQDIQRVVGEYFKAEARTVATLVKASSDGGSKP
ncbi:MAG: pitrilysin family protein [Gemmatimonadota bacterium]